MCGGEGGGWGGGRAEGTSAFFQSGGTVLVSRDSWKIAVTIGAISFASSIRTTGLMESEPAALEGFKLIKSFRTSLAEMSISGIAGTLL